MRTVRQVAAAAGVSVRTLHHYDAIGLLKPAGKGANGYRYYGRAELLRLQQILFYRELGFALADIAAVLDDPAFDAIAALRGHRSALDRRIVRCRDLVRTIDRTIASLEKDQPMNDEDLYAGIAPETRERWQREARAYWGDAAVDAAETRARAMGADEIAAMRREMEDNRRAFVALARDGADPASAAALAVTRRHYRWVCRSWTPDAAQFAGLGRLMVEHSEFARTYDGPDGAPGTAAFVAAAMAAFADTELA